MEYCFDVYSYNMQCAENGLKISKGDFQKTVNYKNPTGKTILKHLKKQGLINKNLKIKSFEITGKIKYALCVKYKSKHMDNLPVLLLKRKVKKEN